jgi:CRP-like cAMP-binding protein
MANQLLCVLPRQEQRRLLAGFEVVKLTFGQVLYVPGEPIRYVYFPNDCLISLLTSVGSNMALETGLVGAEGMVGVPLALGINTSFVRALVQVPGTAMRMEAARFRRTFRDSPPLQKEVFRHIDLLMTQMTQTAACNRFHVVEARLARRLLMTRDRVRSDEFHLTHEFLADMLGVRRVGITKAASALRQRKLIEYRRGKIWILDRLRLEAAACTCYRIVKRLQDRAQP